MNARHHLPLFALALLVALVIKVAVHETEELSERTFSVNVTYTSPPGVTLIEPPEEARVQLKGRTKEITELNPFSVQLVVAIAAGQTGQLAINLDRSNVRTPAGSFEVVSINPNRLLLQVELIQTAVVPIRARLVDEPAAGSLPGEPEVRPSQATISGPASRVRILQELIAQVSLTGHALTFEETVSVLVPDPLIKVDPARVVVHVPMNPDEPAGAATGARSRNQEMGNR